MADIEAIKHEAVRDGLQKAAIGSLRSALNSLERPCGYASRITSTRDVVIHALDLLNELIEHESEKVTDG